MALDPRLAERSTCRLETVGRRSGRRHEIVIWFAADPERERIYLLSGGREAADWVRNLRQAPQVRVRLGGRWLAGTASEIEDGPDDGLARRLLAAKYEGWAEGRRLSSWARNSLPVAIDLADA
ncbi:MAG TPA: nitroreductase family deazaflavin-dependent oxidoreductase [Candidatus Limnocylindrales bacterium]